MHGPYQMLQVIFRNTRQIALALDSECKFVKDVISCQDL